MATDLYSAAVRLNALIDRALGTLTTDNGSAVDEGSLESGTRPRRLVIDPDGPEVPIGCACLCTGWLYVDLDSGDQIVACSYKHALAGIGAKAASGRRSARRFPGHSAAKSAGECARGRS